LLLKRKQISGVSKLVAKKNIRNEQGSK